MNHQMPLAAMIRTDDYEMMYSQKCFINEFERWNRKKKAKFIDDFLNLLSYQQLESIFSTIEQLFRQSQFQSGAILRTNISDFTRERNVAETLISRATTNGKRSNRRKISHMSSTFALAYRTFVKPWRIVVEKDKFSVGRLQIGPPRLPSGPAQIKSRQSSTSTSKSAKYMKPRVTPPLGDKPGVIFPPMANLTQRQFARQVAQIIGHMRRTWTPGQLMTLICDLIAVADYSTRQHVKFAVCTALKRRPNITLLPEYLLLLIFSNLPVASVLKVGGVCKQWSRLARDERLWKIKLQVLGQALHRPELISQLEKEFITQVDNSQPNNARPSWKMLYFQLTKIYNRKAVDIRREQRFDTKVNARKEAEGSQFDLDDVSSIVTETDCPVGWRTVFGGAIGGTLPNCSRDAGDVFKASRRRHHEKQKRMRIRQAAQERFKLAYGLHITPDNVDEFENELQDSDHQVPLKGPTEVAENVVNTTAPKTASSGRQTVISEHSDESDSSDEFGKFKGIRTPDVAKSDKARRHTAPTFDDIRRRQEELFIANEQHCQRVIEERNLAKRLKKRNREDTGLGHLTEMFLPSGNFDQGGERKGGEKQEFLKQQRNKQQTFNVLQIPKWPTNEKPFQLSEQEIDDSRLLQGHMGAVLCLFFDGVRLFTGSADHSVRLWSPTTTKCLKKFIGHKGTIAAIDYRQQDTLLASGGWDQLVLVWHVPENRIKAVLRGHSGSVTGIRFSGDLLISSSIDGTLRVWSLFTMAVRHVVRQDKAGPLGIRWLNTVPMTLSGYYVAGRRQRHVVHIVLASDEAAKSEATREFAWRTTTLLSLDDKVVRPSDERQSARSMCDALKCLDEADRDAAAQITCMCAKDLLLVVALKGGWVQFYDLQKPRVSSSSSLAADAEKEEVFVPRPPVVTPKLLVSFKFTDREASAEDEQTDTAGSVEVRSMDIRNGRLYTGDTEGVVKEYDLANLVCLKRFRAHFSPITCLKASDRYLVSAGEDGKIAVEQLSRLIVPGRSPGSADPLMRK